MKLLYTFLSGFSLAAGLVQTFNDGKAWLLVGIVLCFICTFISHHIE